MYNEPRKERFLSQSQYSDAMKAIARNVFNNLEPHENEWGCEYIFMGQDEVISVAEQQVKRYATKFAKLKVIRDYARWCSLAEGENINQELLELSSVGIGKIKTTMVANPKMMQVYLNSICSPESEEMPDSVIRCYYWMAFAGMEEDDILEVCSSDVRFSDMIISFNGNDYEIYREAIPAFRNCVYLETFRYKHPNYDVIHRVRVDGNKITRGVKGSYQKGSIRAELTKKSKKARELGKTNIELSYGRAWLSGQYYRIYEMECAGEKADFTELTEHHMKGKEYSLDPKYDENVAIDQIYKKIYHGYAKDYERWKLAFH